MIARLVLVTGLAPSVVLNEDWPTLHRVMELHISDLEAMQGKREDLEFAKWKRDMGFE